MPAYGQDDSRTMSERYSYFMRGRQLVIIEHKLSQDVGLNGEPPYQTPTGGGATLTGTNAGDTGRVDSLMLEYTAIPDVSEILNEDEEIPIHDTMAIALVDYIKSQIAVELQEKEYYMGKFNKRVAEYTNARVGGLRRVIGRGF